MKRVVALLILLAVAAVPLAQGAGAEDPATTDPGATLAPTDPGTGTSTAPAPTETAPPATGATPPVTGLIAEGVTIAGLAVGGMTAEQATAAVTDAFGQPLEFKYRKRTWWAEPDRLGARAYVTGAVQRALVAPSYATVDLVVSVKGTLVDDYVAYLNRNFSQPARDSTLRLVKLRPRLSKPHDGFKVNSLAMKTSIVRALRSLDRSTIPLVGTVLRPKVTLKNFGSIVVIRRDSKRLYLYDGQRFLRRFGVATGQPSYPTPLGRFEIVVKQRNPWWYPPTESEWAQDLEPVPPGPGNPLGTRWMGLSAPLVGIHGTPDAASIGYSASHGCIRMLVPDAEWLFERVDIGTPVFITNA